MRPLTSSTLGAVSLLLCHAVAKPTAAAHPKDLSSFIATEKAIALQGALNNIGPNGSLVPGAGSGFVVASPSTVNPDYFYTWSRDSALTLKMLIDEFIFSRDRSLQTTIEDYVHAQAVLQTVSNPSGTFLPEGIGLGEPKFMVDGTSFNGAWGRPQRDGPALRATALISYSNWLIQNRQTDKAKTIWPIISNDLSYVGQYWNQTGFDLWEETDGSSFFTILNQYRALVEGTRLAKTLNVKCVGCDQAPELVCFLQSFWNGEYIVANINVDNGRTGLDGNSILGSISTFDIDASCDGLIFQPCNSKSLANFKALTDSFRDLYTINSGIPEGQGVAVGRYPEDVYYGGNPWYLITTAAAEYLYDAVAQWTKQKSLTVDSTSLAFFKDVYPDVVAKTYTSQSHSNDFNQILASITTYADSYVAVVEKYTPSNGSLSEEFDRDTGVPLSAIDLTWSYAAFVTVSQRRAGEYPASWGSSHASPPPATCLASSAQGVYAPATEAGAPNVTSSCQIEATFNVVATTYYGENIYISGNTSDLGSWNIANAYPMNAGDYTTADPLWDLTVYLTAGETIDYKFVRQENCNQPYIYETVNRTLTVPACGGAAITINATWDGPTGTSGTC